MNQLQRELVDWIWLQLEHHLLYVGEPRGFVCRFCNAVQEGEAKHESLCQYVEGRRLLREYGVVLNDAREAKRLDVKGENDDRRRS